MEPLTEKNIGNTMACAAVFKAISNLPPGRSVVYYRGRTCGLKFGSAIQLSPKAAQPLCEALARMRDEETATFVQRKITDRNGVNRYEYIVVGKK